MALTLTRRPRRNRATPALRELLRETRLHPSCLVQPLFIKDLPDGAREDIPSLPGQQRLSLSELLHEAEQALHCGLHAIALFPCIAPGLKDPEGTHAFHPDQILLKALRALHREFPELLLIADVALDPYTSHGHDGLLTPDGQDVDNDRTVEALCRLAIALADAGAGLVAPSDMMDGRIRAIRHALDAAGFQRTGILSYAAKFASAYYGPFRDAVGSKIGRDTISKATYQLDPANAREARLEAILDIEEGADHIMIKPAGPYLDIIQTIAQTSPIPVWAYQVSGEYAQIHAAARMGWLDYTRTRDEALLAIKRAGAGVIITYFAAEIAREHNTGTGS